MIVILYHQYLDHAHVLDFNRHWFSGFAIALDIYRIYLLLKQHARIAATQDLSRVFNTAAQSTEQLSDESDRATCVEAMGPHVARVTYLEHPLQWLQALHLHLTRVTTSALFGTCS